MRINRVSDWKLEVSSQGGSFVIKANAKVYFRVWTLRKQKEAVILHQGESWTIPSQGVWTVEIWKKKKWKRYFDIYIQ